MAEELTTQWMSVGTEVVSPLARDEFLKRAEAMEFIPPKGSHPLSQGMALSTLIREFKIRPVMRVAYHGAWSGYGSNTGYYEILGIETRKQRIYFVDCGWKVVPVCIVTDVDLAARSILGLEHRETARADA